MTTKASRGIYFYSLNQPIFRGETCKLIRTKPVPWVKVPWYVLSRIPLISQTQIASIKIRRSCILVFDGKTDVSDQISLFFRCIAASGGHVRIWQSFVNLMTMLGSAFHQSASRKVSFGIVFVSCKMLVNSHSDSGS